MNYKKLYDNMMKIAKFSNRIKNDSYYYERHHIIPKCMGGNNSEDNLVLLTAREHYVAHKLLWKINKNNRSLFFAYFSMSNMKNQYHNRIKITSKEYERLKIVNSKMVSEAMTGRTITWANKISESHKGLKHTKESKRKMSIAKKGTKRPKEESVRKSKSMKGKNKGKFYINNGKCNKMIRDSELEYYLSQGYVKGYLRKK